MEQNANALPKVTLGHCFVGKSSALWNRMIGSGYKIIS